MKPKTPVPLDMKISPRVREWANSKGFGDLERHLEHFVLTCDSNGYKYANHDSAFMRAILDDWARIRQGKPSNGAAHKMFVPDPVVERSKDPMSHLEAVRKALRH